MSHTELFNIDLINYSAFLELLVRFSFNLIVSWVLIRYLYYKHTQREEYVFSFLLISTTIFLLIFLLSSVKLKLGFALGLFAIFGIIRYRTNPIPIKEMTYLFAVIGIAVVNSMANKKVSYIELVATNSLVIAVVYLLERFWLTRQLAKKEITYEKIDLIKPQKNSELKKDLEERTGLEIVRVEIGKINFLNDTAKLLIYYKPITDSNFLEESGYNTDDE